MAARCKNVRYVFNFLLGLGLAGFTDWARISMQITISIRIRISNSNHVKA
jgi:hypothetical protein